MSNGTSENHEAAREYARHGYPVFPVQQGGKEPAISKADGGNGFHDGTTDPNVIDAWWKENPARNIGIATGERSFNVLDVDKGKDGNPPGFVALNNLTRAGLIPESRTTIKTPSGGIHKTFKGDDQGSGRLVKRSLDHRAEGGYVVVPPSTVDGKPYVIVQRKAIQPQTLSWQRIVDHLEPERTRPKPVQHMPAREPSREVEGMLSWLEGRGRGDRNFATFWSTARLVEKGLVDDTTRERLIQASVNAGIRGGRREAERTVDSAIANVERGGSPPRYRNAQKDSKEAGS